MGGQRAVTIIDYRWMISDELLKKLGTVLALQNHLSDESFVHCIEEFSMLIVIYCVWKFTDVNTIVAN